jgi:virginiamycin B lyase
MPRFKRGSPTGMLDLETDGAGNLWLGMMYQGAIARFDPRSEHFDYWHLPPDLDSDTAELGMLTMDRDGKLWTNDAGAAKIYHLDPGSGQYVAYDPLKILPGGRRDHRIYDVAADSSNNLFMTDFAQNYLIRLDAETGEAMSYRTPTENARNRRGRMDGEERYFFAEYLGTKLAMLDTRSGEIKEWALPTAWSAPYDAACDENGDLWTASMTTDRIVRIDSKTGATAEYPLPRQTDMRRIFVDQSTSPVSLWVGSTHGASIVHIEPLD